jgi:tetratricopeptide (TPR) repeat protein
MSLFRYVRLASRRERERLAAARRKVTECRRHGDKEKLANALTFIVFSAAGQEEKVTAAREAVGICRELAQQNRSKHLPGLQQALAALGMALQGQRSTRVEGLRSLREAIDLLRELARENPEPYLHNLGLELRVLGMLPLAPAPERASALHEALDVFARVGRSGSAEATCWSYLSSVQFASGNVDDALESGRKALDMYRAAASASPTSVLPNTLSRAEATLGIRLLLSGRHEGAGLLLKAAQTYRRGARGPTSVLWPVNFLAMVVLVVLIPTLTRN